MKRILERRLSVLCVASVIGMFSLLLAAPFANAIESDALKKKQLQQQNARALARDLVSGVLEIQLRQLKENGLEEREIYKQIASMHENIDKLVEAEMQEVVALLVKAQEGTREERIERFGAGARSNSQCCRRVDG